MALEKGRELARVEMIGIVGERVIFRRRHRLGREAIVADAPLRADGVAKTLVSIPRQPVRDEVHLTKILR